MRRKCLKMSHLLGGPKSRGRGPEHAQTRANREVRAIAGVRVTAPECGISLSFSRVAIWRPRAVFAPPPAAQAVGAGVARKCRKMSHFLGGQKLAIAAWRKPSPRQSRIGASPACTLMRADVQNIGERLHTPRRPVRAFSAPPLPAKTPAPRSRK